MENEFDEIWARIKSETTLKSLQSLANIIKISQPAVSEMKGKGKFPPGWAYLVGKRFGLLTEWIMTGDGPKRLDELKGDWVFYEELEQWAKETGQSDNIQWMRNQIESFFPMFKEWKKRRAEGDSFEDGEPESRVA
ncbi:MAG: hypothetical protein PHI97_21890 [Desulfobulbus sp.]|nr:hypothetical protein [Desulfobulbus sp.]